MSSEHSKLNMEVKARAAAALQNQNGELPVVGKYRKLFVRRFQSIVLTTSCVDSVGMSLKALSTGPDNGTPKSSVKSKRSSTMQKFHKAAGHPGDCIKSLQVNLLEVGKGRNNATLREIINCRPFGPLPGCKASNMRPPMCEQNIQLISGVGPSSQPLSVSSCMVMS